MRFVCSHEDALWYWYRKGPERLRSSRRVYNPRLDDTTLSLRRLARLDLSCAGIEPCPAELLGLGDEAPPALTVLVKPSLGGRAPEGLRPHRWYGELPASSVLRIAPKVYVCSPELALLQLSLQLSEVDLIRLCCHLFSGYFVEQGTERIRAREALCSKESVRRFLCSCHERGGRPSLRRAVKRSAEGAASPREIELFLLASLPARLGGYGLTGCRLNPEYRPQEHERALLDRASRQSVRMDLLWEKRCVALEYQGADHVRQLSEDRARINMLSAMGYTVLQVDNEQMLSAERFHALMEQLAKRLGRKLPACDREWRQRNRTLRERLLGPGRMRL